ncbi:MAG: chorismate synthase [Bacteroidales bacterium]|jgi:chorismate synthase|nr:chorismate synthase [Bacteroidales bacterium]MDD4214772.1 chorismate synthase [Bacteroidales bacterium]
MSNSFGELFRISLFGDSHGKAIGGIIDGCFPGMQIDLAAIQKELTKRSAHDFFSTSRKEPDTFEILSGIRNGKTTGGPIGFIIPNKDVKSSHYDELDKLFRPSHADFTYYAKYGSEESAGKLHASGRFFASVIVAGGVARQMLSKANITIKAYVNQIGTVKVGKTYQELDLSLTDQSHVKCPDAEASEKMLRLLKQLKSKGDTTGGVVCCIVNACPPGIGDPVFGKLQSKLAQAMLSIPAVKGFEYGSGFGAASMTGSQHNDIFVIRKNKLRTLTNNSGGIQGGISNGEDIFFHVAFKPVSSIAKEQPGIDRNANNVTFTGKGRHDICLVPRAVSLVEALASITIADSFLKYRAYVEKNQL